MDIAGNRYSLSLSSATCVVGQQATITRCSGSTAARCCRWTSECWCLTGWSRWRPVNTSSSLIQRLGATIWSSILYGWTPSRYRMRESTRVRCLHCLRLYSVIELSSTVSRITFLILPLNYYHLSFILFFTTPLPPSVCLSVCSSKWYCKGNQPYVSLLPRISVFSSNKT